VQTKPKISDDVCRTPSVSGSSVLVLDDEAPVRDVVCRFLDKHGYQSVEASTVNEAAALLQDAPVVAVLLDVRLSGPGSGLDLLTQLRQQPALASTPAIVMTGGVLSDAEKGVVEKNGGLLFYKPDGLTALISFLHQVTGRNQESQRAAPLPAQ
jgi:two-component system phosphate regulon response regulator PhoB